jgi:predicted oxidoreductase
MVSRLQLANTDLSFSRLIPGLWRLTEWNFTTDDLHRWIAGCIEMGMTTFDHADIYGGYRCEALFGEVLARDASLRGKIELVTKCGIALINERYPAHRVKHYNTSRAHITASVEQSLVNLRTDHLDLLLIHRPDPFMNADDTAQAFYDLRQAGKVRHFGVSNFTPSQFDLLQSRLDFPLVTNQIEFSVTHVVPLYDGTLDQAQRLRVPPMAWSPLGGGSLFRSDDATAQRVRHTLTQIGQAHGVADVETVALAWLLAHPANVLPVLGTSKLDRLQKAAAAESLILDRQEWFAILEASNGRDVP